ncbi:MAG: hypothetical protein HGJ94_16735 [Desulfosarcina sp.]|nr:hypothetical protein [Desulfosarcina sp.]
MGPLVYCQLHLFLYQAVQVDRVLVKYSPCLRVNLWLTFIDQQDGGYWAYFVEPGKHTFSTSAAILQGSFVTIDSKETGEEYYIRMDVMAGAFVSDAKLFRVYPEQGQQEILACKMIK